jgi:hypothetical protein
MTMTREAKATAKQFLTGAKVEQFASPKLRAMCRAEGRDGYAMTPAEYAEHRMGRRTMDAETARWRKMEHAGWTIIEGTNYYRRTVRR